jgi:ADP-ribose pyrophosphatase YjhB (NUDIX family)
MVRGVDFIAVNVLCYCITEDGLWVVHKRGKKCKTPDVWNFVSGKLELGEQPSGCAYREVQEEYGCKPLGVVALEPHANVMENANGKKYHFLMLPYFVRINSGDLKPNKREVADMAFVDSFDEIPTPHHPGLMSSLEHHRENLMRMRRGK